MLSNIWGKLTKYYKLDLSNPYCKYFINAQSNDLKILKQQRHLCYYNIDVPFCYLYLTKYNGINLCVYIEIVDSNTIPRMIAVKHRFDDHMYDQDTLFEGKMVYGNDNQWHYLISDLIIYNNHSYQSNLLEKLRVINNILFDNHRPDKILDPCCISL